MFPKELKLLKNWVGFKLPSKMPMSPVTGNAAESNNKATWGTYEEAVGAMQKYSWDGVGFMFEPPYVGIDLDDCITDGVINDFAKDILAKCNSYAEFSPSRTGIHIIGKGRLSAPLKKPYIEVYQNQRYFTVTQKLILPARPLREINLSFLDELRDKKTGPLDLGRKLGDIREGSRNNDFTAIAGSLRARGYGKEDIYELLRPKAAELNFPDRELWTICQSVSRYQPNMTADSQAASVESFLSDTEEVKWIAAPIIARKAIGFVAGLPETMKTWLLVDLAVECAKGGGLWLNRFPVSAARVLFIDQERFKGETQRRFRAVLKYKGLSADTLKGALFVRCGTSTRIDLQNSYEAFRKEVADIRPDLVLIDSFATFHTKEENNRKDIQEVLERVKQIRSEFGCTIVFIHHENKFAFNAKKEDREPSIAEMAGNVAIPAAGEFAITVRRQDSESSFVYHTKSTLGPKTAPFLVKVIDKKEDRSEISVEAF